MSRGLGRVELGVLEVLGGNERLRLGQITFEIAGRTEPTEALRASVGRALASLRRKGRLVRVMGDWMLTETWQRRVKQQEHEEELRSRRESLEGSEKCSANDQSQKGARPDGKANNTVRGQVDYRDEARKLLKILALLGSPYEGEVLNAARQAEQIRCRLRLSWEEIITLPTAHTKAGTAKAEYGPNFAP